MLGLNFLMLALLCNPIGRGPDTCRSLLLKLGYGPSPLQLINLSVQLAIISHHWYLKMLHY